MFVSVTCEGERCHCGKAAVRKVGEEIPFDDPDRGRHNLTAYVCAEHYAELMGPLGAEHVGIASLESQAGVVEALREAREAFKRIANGEVGQPENLAFNAWQMIERVLQEENA